MTASTLAPAAPTDFVQARLDKLHASGFGTLEPTLLGTLATNQTTSDDAMLGMAGIFHGALNTARRAFSFITDDPVLHKEPSHALMLHQSITGTIGWLPVAEPDLSHVQQRLQAMGFGAGLPATGVWTPDWNSEFIDAAQKHAENQMAGQGKPLTVPAKKAAHGFLASLLPSHALPALVGWVESIPPTARQFYADAYGGIDNMSTRVGALLGGENPFGAHASHAAGTAQAQTGSAIERSLGRNVSAEQYRAEIDAHPYVRALDDALAAFSLVPIMGAGSAVAHAGGEAITRGLLTDLGAAEARRGPGIVANRLYRPAIAEGERATGLFAARPFMATPILKQMGAAVRFNATDGGWYYTGRTFLAQPMRLPAVQLPLKALQATTLAGAAERGLAAVEDAAGGHQRGRAPLADAIYAQHAIAGPWGTALDLLSGVGKVSIGAKLSETAGAPFRAADHLANNSLGTLGVRGAWERGTGLSYERTVRDLAKAGVDQSEFDAFLNDKLATFASARHAQEQIDSLGRDAPVGTARGDQFLSLTREARSDPAILATQRQALLDDLNELTVRFRKDSNVIVGDPREHLSQGIANYLLAKRAATRLFAEHPHALNSPEARDIVDASVLSTKSGQEPKLASGFLAAEGVTRKPGSWGLATLDTPTAQDTMRKAQGWLATLRKVGLRDQVDTELMSLEQEGLVDGGIIDAAERHVKLPTLADEEAAAKAEQTRREAYSYLVQHHGLDPIDASGLDAVQMVSLVYRQAKHTATEIPLLRDAPPEAKALYAKLTELGYKPVAGSGIGFEFDPPMIDPVAIEGGISFQRRVLGVMGLSPEHWSTRDAGQLTSTAIERSWQEAINDGTIKAPPGMNAARLLVHVRDQLAKELPAGARAFYSLARRNFAQVAELRVAHGLAKDNEEAFGQIAQEIAREQSLREVPLRKFRKAVMAMPDTLREVLDLPDDLPMVAEQHADKLYALMLNAMSKRPGYIFGASRIEDVTRSGFGLAGLAAHDVPFSRIVARAANGFNTSFRWRNRWRFSYSPSFSVRRAVKTAYKMGVEGATPTVRPLAYMLKRGTFEQATKILDRIYPDEAARGAAFDALDQLLHEQDIFGIYNPRHFMASAAHDWAAQGKSDDEIRKLIERTFTYGDRSAMERTMGTIFYPFSFERTLYRNTGAYLLDNPGPRLALLAAVDAYQALDSQGKLSDFMKRHLPILHELNRMNAFAEGIGPGELGGINMPYFDLFHNLFKPQQWDTKSAGKRDLVTFASQAMPVFADLNRMLLGIRGGKSQGGSVVQQGRTTFWGAANALQDAYHWVKGDHRFFDSDYRFWHPQHTTNTTNAQVDDAWRMRGLLIGKLQQVLDYNYHHSGHEIRWPDAAPLPPAIRGASVNRTSIAALVKAHYPDWNPDQAAVDAEKRQRLSDEFLANLRAVAPARAKEYATFSELAQKVNAHIIKGDYAEPRAIALTAQFRQAAVNLAEQDGDFLKFYNNFGYRSIFGPLEALY